MAFDILEEMQRIVRSLETSGVDYALAGAFALAIHGVPRATNDIDLLILPEDLERALGAASSVGFRVRARPTSFRSGVSIERVTKAAEGEVLTLDFVIASPPLREVWTPGSAWRRSERNFGS